MEPTFVSSQVRTQVISTDHSSGHESFHSSWVNPSPFCHSLVLRSCWARAPQSITIVDVSISVLENPVPCPKVPAHPCAHPAFHHHGCVKGSQGCVWSQCHNPGPPPTAIWVRVTASLEWAPWFQFPPWLPLPKTQTALRKELPVPSFCTGKCVCLCCKSTTQDKHPLSATATRLNRPPPPAITDHSSRTGPARQHPSQPSHTTYFT